MFKTFDTPEPLELELRWPFGDVHVDDRAQGQTRVAIDGDDDLVAECTVELRGSRLVVLGPTSTAGKNRAVTGFRLAGIDVNFGGLGFRDAHLELRISLPPDSSLDYDLVSADLDADGRWERVRGESKSGSVDLGTVREAKLQSASGDVTIARCLDDCEIRTASGDFRLDDVGGGLRVSSGSGDIDVDGPIGGDADLKSGSGDIEVASVGGTLKATTGSGDLTVGEVRGPAAARSGSGDVALGEIFGTLQASTASGTLSVARLSGFGRVQANAAAGDIRLGIPEGVPVWTDLHSVSGDVFTDLAGVGEPADDEPYLELRASTVSGDISLIQA